VTADGSSRDGWRRSRPSGPPTEEDFGWLSDLRGAPDEPGGIGPSDGDDTASRGNHASDVDTGRRRGRPSPRQRPQHSSPADAPTAPMPPGALPRDAPPVVRGFRLDPPLGGVTTGELRALQSDRDRPAPRPKEPPRESPAPVTPTAGRQAADPITGDHPVAPTGRRAEIRRHFRQLQQLRTATVVVALLVILGAPLAFYVVREVTRDPVFVELDGLDLPSWAARQHSDQAEGSRWCIRECRFRERTWESQRSPVETDQAYERALREAGWRVWNAPGCPPENIDGFETCWQRDEYVLDMWIREPTCETLPRFGASPGANPPAAAPGASTAPSPAASPSGCSGALVTVRVINRIGYRPPADGA
jgi:hypothetical protein